MNIQSNAVPEPPPGAGDIAPAAVSATTETRPLYWSVRRELWENRSIYIAPLAAAAVLLLGISISMIGLPDRRRAALLLDPSHMRAAIQMPYDIVGVVILLTAFIVAFFYCLDALHSERRDRSILFWKSLPVSDLTTVLSKACIPLVILPLLVFVIIAATQLIVLLLSSAVLLMSGMSAATTWANFNLFLQSLILLYSLIAFSLWFAPIYGWLLLVSGWARRVAFLWAVLPLVAIQVFEKIAFNTSYFGSMLQYRLVGGFTEAFAVEAQSHGVIHRLEQLDPFKFLSTPGLWIGLGFAAAFLAAAVWLRRYRDPI